MVGWWQGDLPANKHVVITSWGRTDRCGSVSDNVVNAFYKAHLNAAVAPEAGSPAIPNADTLPAGQLPPTAAPSPSASATTSPSPTSTSTKK